MLLSLASTVFGLVALTQAVDHAVVVGGPGGIVAYDPPSVNAVVGDTVTFTFKQKNHTVSQSSFESPCSPLQGGFDSGFQPVAENNTAGPFPAATLTIQDTDPIWIYCQQTNPVPHCSEGMVFAINPKDGQLEAFQAAAKATAGSASASNPYGTPAAASSSAPSTAPAPSSAPTDHRILVGDGGSLTYNPPNITAQVGDTITFEFRAKNHTISQSSFKAPCRPLGATSGSPGFDSGFMPVAAGSTDFPTYTILVNDTNPIWGYCGQTEPKPHCGAGMVFAANAVESSPNSFEAFTSLAKQLNGTTSTSANGTSVSNSTSGASSTVVHNLAALMAVTIGVVAAL